MDYNGKQMADSIREGVVKRRGFMGRDSTPLEIPQSTDTMDIYKSLIDSMFDDKSREGVGEGTLGIEDPTEEAPEVSTRPPGSVKVPEEVKNDPEFAKEVARLSKKYGFSKQELYRVIQGESAFNPQAQNPSGATGLFQFMPEVAAELGWTTEEIKYMAPAEQLKVYDQYLSRWNFSGKNALGIMQAAPAFASASPGTVVYEKGTAAWKQNPGWRPADGGDITVASINNYYNRKRA